MIGLFVSSEEVFKHAEEVLSFQATVSRIRCFSFEEVVVFR